MLLLRAKTGPIWNDAGLGSVDEITAIVESRWSEVRLGPSCLEVDGYRCGQHGDLLRWIIQLGNCPILCP